MQKLGIFQYNNKQLYDKTKNILTLEDKQQDRYKTVNLLTILSVIAWTHLRNDFHDIKVIFSEMLFHSSTADLSEPIFWMESCICFAFENAS